MANPVCKVLLTEEALEGPMRELTPSTSVGSRVNAGAIVDFWGVVRASEDRREIDGIEYEAHREMAEHQLKRVAQQASESFTLQSVVIHHRIGFIPSGEPSLFVRIAGRHRAEAFRASQWVVDELKKKAPIWKRPRFKVENPRLASPSEAASVK